MMRENRPGDFRIDFIGIGAQKAGTSWVNKILSEHPQICTAQPKETHFFNDKPAFGKGNPSGNFTKGLRWYALFFRHCSSGMLRGEITPRYLTDPVVPGRIKSFFPHVKLILCLRSPVARAVSQYYFERYTTRREKRPLSEAVRDQEDYVENGRYFFYLKNYLVHFPISQIHFVWMEDIKKDPVAVAAGLYTFLGVENNFLPPSVSTVANETRKSRSKWVRDLIHRSERILTGMGLSGFAGFLKRSGITSFLAIFTSSKLRYPQPDPADKQWLTDQFRDDILQLQELTGRDLTSWLA